MKNLQCWEDFDRRMWNAWNRKNTGKLRTWKEFEKADVVGLLSNGYLTRIFRQYKFLDSYMRVGCIGDEAVMSLALKFVGDSNYERFCRRVMELVNSDSRSGCHLSSEDATSGDNQLGLFGVPEAPASR